MSLHAQIAAKVLEQKMFDAQVKAHLVKAAKTAKAYHIVAEEPVCESCTADFLDGHAADGDINEERTKERYNILEIKVPVGTPCVDCGNPIGVEVKAAEEPKAAEVPTPEAAPAPEAAPEPVAEERVEEPKKATEYKLANLGVEHPDYFQGAGTSFTTWEDAFVGIGDSEKAAGDDAVEQAAAAGWDFTDVAAELDPEVAELDSEDDIGEESEMFHYVVLYVKSDKVKEAPVVEAAVIKADDIKKDTDGIEQTKGGEAKSETTIADPTSVDVKKIKPTSVDKDKLIDLPGAPQAVIELVHAAMSLTETLADISAKATEAAAKVKADAGEGAKKQELTNTVAQLNALFNEGTVPQAMEAAGVIIAKITGDPKVVKFKYTKKQEEEIAELKEKLAEIDAKALRVSGAIFKRQDTLQVFPNPDKRKGEGVNVNPKEALGNLVNKKPEAAKETTKVGAALDILAQLSTQADSVNPEVVAKVVSISAGILDWLKSAVAQLKDFVKGLGGLKKDFEKMGSLILQ